MSNFFTIDKDPQAELDYTWDWKPLTNGSDDPDATDWLESGETIASHTVTAESGLTVDSSSLTDSSTSVTAWLSGGTAGTHYEVVCHIETSNATSRKDDRTLKVYVKQR